MCPQLLPGRSVLAARRRLVAVVWPLQFSCGVAARPQLPVEPLLKGRFVGALQLRPLVAPQPFHVHAFSNWVWQAGYLMEWARGQACIEKALVERSSAAR